MPEPKEGRLRALDLTPSAAKFNGGSEEVLLVLTPDSRVKALTPRQAKIAWEAGKLIGWNSGWGRGRTMRLYGRFCLSCGFVIHHLYPRRPFPITRRCGLCRRRDG